jgi:hypothetical protein
MIFLTKNQSNTVILTLTEESRLLTPTYIFEFTNDMDKNQVIFSSPDLSTFKCKYNRFEITESGATYTNLSGGTINLNRVGFWDYKVYETSGSTIALSATTGRVLEQGKVYVNGVANDVLPAYR